MSEIGNFYLGEMGTKVIKGVFGEALGKEVVVYTTSLGSIVVLLPFETIENY